MAYIVESRESAESYQVQSGDTLESIANEKCPDVGWETLAFLNWGTKLPSELLRALIDSIGVKTSELAAPSIKAHQIGLEPNSDLDTNIKIPKIWKKKGLEANTEHNLLVKRITAANAISVVALDKWFIPKIEECELEYNLEGDDDSADSLKVEVYGSNYCECNDLNEGLGSYGAPGDLIDEPLYTEDLDPKERSSELLKWAGQTTTTQGMLGRKTGAEAERYINVAFSPYTAHFRYWKAAADANARLILEPFWPQWTDTESTPAVTANYTGAQATFDWTNADEQECGVLEVFDNEGQRVFSKILEPAKLASGAQQLRWNKKYTNTYTNGVFKSEYIDDSAAPTPAETHLFVSMPYTAKITTIKKVIDANSLKVKWEIKNSNQKLARGHIRIIDTDDKTVFIVPLAKGKLADGTNEFVWDGKYADGITNSKNTDIAITDDMPYRVKIECNAGINQEEGLALSAMHSEVRLYVHNENHQANDIRYDAFDSKPSIGISKAKFVPGTVPAESDGTLWYRYQLAEAGFHPGPITDDAAADDAYKIALKEFKRSVPADGSVVAPNFSRMTLAGANATEVENAETATALKTLRAGDKRQLFGNNAAILANSDMPDLSDADFSTKIADTKEEIVLWVDDRQYNTEDNSKDENNNNFLTGSPDREAFGLKNYRGKMSIADQRTDIDAIAISRPWIPLQADLCLLSRTDKLNVTYNKSDVITPSADKRKAMRQAIGPLRVDWMFDETPMDVSNVDTSAYDSNFTRSRKYMAWAMYNNKATYTRKDTTRDATYTNCKESLGGIRPNSLGQYYQQAFGLDNLSLAPWKAQANASTETITTVVHEHLTSGQTEDQDLFVDSSLGRAGVYFNPSRIAGDGYQVRTQVVFDKFSGYDFPNLESLKKRYPAAPTATSAKLRIWRRSSVRGFMCWGTDKGHWPNYLNGMRELYRSAHTYFVHEGGITPRSFPVTDVFDPAIPSHVTTYKNTIKNNTGAGHNDVTKMQLRADDIWPWGHTDRMGESHWVSPEGLTPAQLYSSWISNSIITPTWRRFRTGLLFSLVKQIEKNGVMRGHTLVEFDASPAVDIQEYTCDGHVQHIYWVARKNGAAGLPSRTCPIPGCKTGPSPTAPRSTLAYTGRAVQYTEGFPLPAVGIALGATWLFTSHVSPETWAHELGHHRHFEHAASAPGAQYQSTNPYRNLELHDSETNTTPNWAALGVTDLAEQRWDKHCIMSYENVKLYFCGKCQLRNRGWKIQTLGYPGAKVREP